MATELPDIQNIHFNKLCDYGCGLKGKHQLKNGKWCCCHSANKCIINRNKNIKGHDKRRKPNRDKPALCDYGCGNIAIYQFKNGKWCCSKSQNSCNSVSEKLSISATGYKQPILRKKNHGLKIKKLWEDKTSKYHNKERKNKLRKEMLDGKAVYMNKFIKNPSKPQVELYKRIKKIYPSAELNYPLYREKGEKNYSLDVVIPELKIFFESDGLWFHQDIEKDLERQNDVIKLGWKVIRYIADSIKDVPPIRKIKTDIKKLIKEK